MLGLRKLGGCQIDLHQGDLTRFVCDAMVNPVDDGQYDGSAVGTAVATEAGELPARWVIHAMGPVWRGGEAREEELLAATYREIFRTAAKLGARHLALPSLSTGTFGYPVELAAPLAIQAVKKFVEEGPRGKVARVTFVLFSAAQYETFQEALFSIIPEVM